MAGPGPLTRGLKRGLAAALLAAALAPGAAAAPTSDWEVVAAAEFLTWDGGTTWSGSPLGVDAWNAVLLPPGAVTAPGEVQVRPLVLPYPVGSAQPADPPRIACAAANASSLAGTSFDAVLTVERDADGAFLGLRGYLPLPDATRSSAAAPSRVTCVTVANGREGSWTVGDTYEFSLQTVPVDTASDRFAVAAKSGGNLARGRGGRVYPPGTVVGDTGSEVALFYGTGFPLDGVLEVRLLGDAGGGGAYRCRSGNRAVLPDGAHLGGAWGDGHPPSEPLELRFAGAATLPATLGCDADPAPAGCHVDRDVSVLCAILGTPHRHTFTVAVLAQANQGAWRAVAGPQARDAFPGRLVAAGTPLGVAAGDGAAVTRLLGQSSQHAAEAGSHVRLGWRSAEAPGADLAVQCSSSANAALPSFSVTVPAGTAATAAGDAAVPVALAGTGDVSAEDHVGAGYVDVMVTCTGGAFSVALPGGGPTATLTETYRFLVRVLRTPTATAFEVQAAGAAATNDAGEALGAGATLGIDPGAGGDVLAVPEGTQAGPGTLQLAVRVAAAGAAGEVRCASSAAHLVRPFSAAVDGTEAAGDTRALWLPFLRGVASDTYVEVSCAFEGTGPWLTGEAHAFTLLVTDANGGAGGVTLGSPSANYSVVSTGGAVNVAYAPLPAGTPVGDGLGGGDPAAAGDAPAVLAETATRAGELLAVRVATPPVGSAAALRCSANRGLPSIEVALPEGEAGDVPVQVPRLWVEEGAGALDVQFVCEVSEPDAGGAYGAADLRTFSLRIERPPPRQQAWQFDVRGGPDALGLRGGLLAGEDLAAGGDAATWDHLTPVLSPAWDGTAWSPAPGVLAHVAVPSPYHSPAAPLIECASSRPGLLGDVSAALPTYSETASYAAPDLWPLAFPVPGTDLSALRSPVRVHYTCRDTAPGSTLAPDAAATFAVAVIPQVSNPSYRLVVRGANNGAAGGAALAAGTPAGGGAATPRLRERQSLASLLELELTAPGGASSQQLVCEPGPGSAMRGALRFDVPAGAPAGARLPAAAPAGDLPASGPVDADEVVWYACAPAAARRSLSVAPGDLLTFPVLLQDTSRANGTFRVVAGAALDVAYASPPAQLAPGDVLGDVPGEDLAAVDELAAPGPGQLARLEVTAASPPADAFGVTCASSEPGLVASFGVGVTGAAQGATYDLPVPAFGGTDADREVLFTCVRDGAPAEAHSFTVLVRNTDGNENFAVVASGLARLDTTGALLAAGADVGRESGVDRLRLDEHAATGPGDVVALRVKVGPGAALSVGCRSSDAGLMADFAVPVGAGDLAAGSTVPAQLPAPGEVAAGDAAEVTYECTPDAPSAPWAATDVHKFVVSVRNVNDNASFDVVADAAAGLRRRDGSAVPGGARLVDYDEGLSVVSIAEAAAPVAYGALVVTRAPGVAATVQCVSDRVLSGGALTAFSVPVGAGAGPGDLVPFGIPTGDVAADAEVVFTCRPTAAFGDWAPSDQHRFRVFVAAATANGRFRVEVTAGGAVARAGGGTFGAGEAVGLGADAVAVDEGTFVAHLAIAVLASPGAAVAVVCETSDPAVSADGAGGAFLFSVASGAAVGSTVPFVRGPALSPCSLPDCDPALAAYPFAENVAVDTDVEITCRPQAAAGGWLAEDVHAFGVAVRAADMPGVLPASTVFSPVADAGTRREDGTPIPAGTPLSLAAVPAVSEAVASGDGDVIDLQVLTATDAGGPFRVRCSPQHAGLAPFDFTVPAASAAGAVVDTPLLYGGLPGSLVADTQVLVECAPVFSDGALGTQAGVFGANGGRPHAERAYFWVKLRRERIRVVAGTWAWDSALGTRLEPGADRLGYRGAGPLRLTDAAPLLTERSALDDHSVAMVRATTSDYGAGNADVRVSCSAGGDPDLADVTGAPATAGGWAGLGLLDPASQADPDGTVRTVRCGPAATAGDFVAGVDVASFRVVKRVQRLRAVAGAGAHADATGAPLAPGTDLTVVGRGTLPPAATVRHGTAYPPGSAVVLQGLGSPAAAVPLACESTDPALLGVSGPVSLPSGPAGEEGVPLARSGDVAAPDATPDFEGNPAWDFNARPVRLVCYPDPARGLADGFAPSDRVAFIVTVRAERFRVVAGDWAVRAGDGALLAPGTRVGEGGEEVALAQGVALPSDAGRGVLAVVPVADPGAPVPLDCAPDDPSQWEDAPPAWAGAYVYPAPPAGTRFGLALPRGAVAGATVAAAVTCRPVYTPGAAWSPVDQWRFTVHLRVPRLVAVAGTAALSNHGGFSVIPPGTPLGADAYDAGADVVQLAERASSGAGEVAAVRPAGAAPTADVRLACFTHDPASGADSRLPAPEGTTLAAGSAAAAGLRFAPSRNVSTGTDPGFAAFEVFCAPDPADPSADASFHPSDVAAFAVAVRERRFAVRAGPAFYRASDGAQLSPGAELEGTADDWSAAVAPRARTPPGGVVELGQYAGRPLGGLPLTVECASDAPALLADLPPLEITAAGQTLSVQVPRVDPTYDLAADTPVTYTCAPAVAPGAGGAGTDLAEWSPGDRVEFRVVVRTLRVTALAGSIARRLDGSRMDAGVDAVGSSLPWTGAPDADAVLVAEDLDTQPGELVRLRLAAPTRNSAAVDLSCSSTSPGLVPTFRATLPGSATTPVDLDFPTVGNVGSDQDVVITCEPDPALYPTAVSPDLGLFKSDVLVIDVVVKNNEPPVTGLDPATNVYLLPAVLEDSGAATYDILALDPQPGVSSGADLDPEGQPVTFQAVCTPARGAFAWVDAANGVFSYQPDPDAFGEDALVFEVRDNLGAGSPFGIVTFPVTGVPDPATAIDRAIDALDDTPQSFRWAEDGFLDDPDGRDDPEDGVELVTLTSLPSLPGDLSVATADVITYRLLDRETGCPGLAAEGCYPYQVKATSFLYGTGRDSATAMAGADGFSFSVTDRRGGVTGAAVTISVTRLSLNDTVPEAQPFVATVGEGGSVSGPFMTAVDTDLAPDQLTYEITSQPLHGTVEIHCPEPASWADQTRPLVVSPPRYCETPFGSRNLSQCDPACGADCTPADCVEARGVLDGSGPDSFVEDPTADAPGTPLRRPLVKYQAPRNFFGADTISFRARNRSNYSNAQTVRVDVTNDAGDPDLPLPLCGAEAQDPGVTTLWQTVPAAAREMEEGPARNWAPDGAPVCPAGTPGSGPGALDCALPPAPDFSAVDPEAYLQWEVGVANDLRSAWAPDRNEPPQAALAARLKALVTSDVVFSAANADAAQVVCSPYRALQAPMRDAANGRDGRKHFLTYLYWPDAGAPAVAGLRYLAREVAVDREAPFAAPLAGMTRAPATGNLLFAPAGQVLEGILDPSNGPTVEAIYATAEDLGTATDATSLQAVGDLPQFLSYRAPDLVAGNVVSRYQWGYAGAELAGGVELVTDALDFVPVGYVDTYVSCAPGYRSTRPASPGRAELWSCVPCDAGWYNEPGVEEQVSCSRCPAGTASPPGSTSCTPCPLRSYADAEGQGACKQCPDPRMRTPGLGTRSREECRCPPGTFRRPGTDACTACAGNVVCSVENQPIPLPGADGVFVDPASGRALECVVRQACPRWSDFSDVMGGRCGTGYTAAPGEACGRCDLGYYKAGTRCKKCQNNTIFFILVGIVVLLLLAPVLMKLAQKNVFGSINILVVFFQTTNVFASLSWDWPQASLSRPLGRVVPCGRYHMHNCTGFEAEMLLRRRRWSISSMFSRCLTSTSSWRRPSASWGRSRRFIRSGCRRVSREA